MIELLDMQALALQRSLLNKTKNQRTYNSVLLLIKVYCLCTVTKFFKDSARWTLEQKTQDQFPLFRRLQTFKRVIQLGEGMGVIENQGQVKTDDEGFFASCVWCLCLAKRMVLFGKHIFGLIVHLPSATKVSHINHKQIVHLDALYLFL